jgi:hypothetical protein
VLAPDAAGGAVTVAVGIRSQKKGLTYRQSQESVFGD